MGTAAYATAPSSALEPSGAARASPARTSGRQQRPSALLEALAEGMGERHLAGRCPGLAEADLAEQVLAVALDHAEQRERHVEEPGDEPREPVEGLLRRRIEQLQTAQGERLPVGRAAVSPDARGSVTSTPVHRQCDERS